VSNKILLCYFVFNHCHFRIAALTGAAGRDCVTPRENVGEEFVDLLCAHMADIKAPGTVAD
jgi:hypothetical protein